MDGSVLTQPNREYRNTRSTPGTLHLLLANRWWEVPLRVQKLDLATGRREDVMIVRPGELTGAVQIVQGRVHRGREELCVRGAEDGVAFVFGGEGE